MRYETLRAVKVELNTIQTEGAADLILNVNVTSYCTHKPLYPTSAQLRTAKGRVFPA